MGSVLSFLATRSRALHGINGGVNVRLAADEKTSHEDHKASLDSAFIVRVRFFSHCARLRKGDRIVTNKQAEIAVNQHHERNWCALPTSSVSFDRSMCHRMKARVDWRAC